MKPWLLDNGLHLLWSFKAWFNVGPVYSFFSSPFSNNNRCWEPTVGGNRDGSKKLYQKFTNYSSVSLTNFDSLCIPLPSQYNLICRPLHKTHHKSRTPLEIRHRFRCFPLWSGEIPLIHVWRSNSSLHLVKFAAIPPFVATDRREEETRAPMTLSVRFHPLDETCQAQRVSEPDILAAEVGQRGWHCLPKWQPWDGEVTLFNPEDSERVLR